MASPAWVTKAGLLSSTTEGTNFSLQLEVTGETSGTETTDLPLSRLSRAQYSHITNKASEGKPNQFFVNKQLSPTITVYPVPDLSSTYTLYLNVLTRMDDADSATNTMDMPFRFYPCLAAGLAYYVSLKRAPNRTQILKAIYEEEFQRAAAEDRDRASLTITPSRDYYTFIR